MWLLLVAGDHAMHVRGRDAAWPTGVAPGTPLAHVVAMRSPDLLDVEIPFRSLGHHCLTHFHHSLKNFVLMFELTNR